MSRTIKELNELISEAQKEVSRTSMLVHQDPEYIAARRAFIATEERVRAKYEPEKEKAITNLRELKKELLNIRKAKQDEKPKVPDRALAIIKFLGSGVEGSSKWHATWWSEDCTFVLIRKPWGNYWSDIASQAYGPTEHTLVYFAQDEDLLSSGHRGASTKYKIKEWEGRFIRSKKEEMLQLVSEMQQNIHEGRE